ncbi:hypothetical protein, partial [Pantoea ananatis]|uniref:hypothetical protein n=1 Tax=Pantoea ananas TaxID=553 RepID=UPI0023AE9899
SDITLLSVTTPVKNTFTDLTVFGGRLPSTTLLIAAKEGALIVISRAAIKALYFIVESSLRFFSFLISHRGFMQCRLVICRALLPFNIFHIIIYQAFLIVRVRIFFPRDSNSVNLGIPDV